MEKKWRLNILIGEILLYWLAMFFSLLLSAVLKKESIDGPALTSLSLWQFLIFFFVSSSVLVFSVRVFKKGWIWQLLFALAVFSGANVVFGVFMGDLFAAALALALTSARFYFNNVFWHNLSVLVAIIGISSLLGLSITPYSVIFVLLVLSVYDFVAVYKTKHMVVLAQTMIEHHAVLAFIMPSHLRSLGLVLENVEPGEEFVFVGGGDVALPLVMLVSSAQMGLRNGLFVGAAILLGVLATHWIFVSKKFRPIPALPPLASFAILGFLLSLI